MMNKKVCTPKPKTKVKGKELKQVGKKEAVNKPTPFWLGKK